jgi:fructokinase
VGTCIFGEVLFDRFLDGTSVLGGAPFNVAWHLNAFGEAPLFLSAVGDDAAGVAIHDAMMDWGMDLTGLRVDPEHATGEVVVRLAGGEPSYDIVPDRAWDHIRQPRGAVVCELLYHGTLAVRSPESAASLARLKECEPGTLFLDVNLRDPWWQRETVLGLLADADWVKLNGDELDVLAPPEGRVTRAGRIKRARALCAQHGLAGVILTLGAKGAVGVTPDADPVEVAPRGKLEVVDAVGAGDAFASVCILGLRRGWGLPETLGRAQELAALIVGQRGATAADPGLYEPLIERWGLAPG